MWPYGKRVFIGVIKGRSLRGDHSGLSGWALNYITNSTWGFPGDTVVKNLPANGGGTREVGLIPGSGRSPGAENGNLPQYSCLENSMDRGAWWAQRVRHTRAHTWVLLRETQRRDTQGEAGEGHVEMQQGWEWCGHKPRKTGATRNRGSQDISFTRAFGRSPPLLTPWFQASGLHNDLRINSTVLKLPALQ